MNTSKHNIGDMFVRIDYENREGTVIKIAAKDSCSYQVISHDGSWWLLTDDEIAKYKFKKIWTRDLDKAIEYFYDD